jgi:hypothetical protein
MENISSNQLIASVVNFLVFGDKMPETAAYIFHVLSFRISILNVDSVSYCWHGGMLLEKYIGNSSVYMGFADVPGETMLVCVLHQN